MSEGHDTATPQCSCIMRLTTWNLRNGAGRNVWPELAADLVFFQEADTPPKGDGVVWQRLPGERSGQEDGKRVR